MCVGHPKIHGQHQQVLLHVYDNEKFSKREGSYCVRMNQKVL